MSFYEILEDIAPDSIGQAEQVLGMRLQGGTVQEEDEDQDDNEN